MKERKRILKQYIGKARQDSNAELKEKGTPVLCLVNEIRRTFKGYKVSASPTSGLYADNKFVSIVKHIKSDVRIGSEVICWVDEMDADDQFFLEV